MLATAKPQRTGLGLSPLLGRCFGGCVRRCAGAGSGGAFASAPPPLQRRAWQHTQALDAQADGHGAPSSTRDAHDTSTAGVFSASIASIERLTPTVQGFRFAVSATARDAASFAPGQWVDLFVDGLERPGGFSIVSSPEELRRQGTLTLAVKASSSPVVGWLHSEARVGSRVRMRVGGKFVWDAAAADARRPLLLVAGGVGLTPLLSILRSAAAQPPNSRPNLALLLSAQTADELLYREEIGERVAAGELEHCALHCTRGGGEAAAGKGAELRHGRIDKAALEGALRALSGPVAYICGPPALCGAVEAALTELGLPAADIRRERW